MIIHREVKMLTPLLAAKMNQKLQPPRREFTRVCVAGKPDGVHIANQLARWKWAFLEARDALGFTDVSVAAIIPCHYFSVRRTSTYNRKFRRGRTMVSEAFEALPTGQTVAFEFTLSKHLPPHGDGNGRFVRTPDEDEFDRMLAHIGEYLGMSEWGQDYLYGRFKLKTENEQNTAEIPADAGRQRDDDYSGHSGCAEVFDAEMAHDGEEPGADADREDDVPAIHAGDDTGHAGT
jgi:hypothetical protein